jgi:hypothetical protein
LTGKRLQIFRAGRHTASDGTTHEFTEQMLRDVVSAYNPTLHEAPMVVGHPQHDLPAYGWVRGLHFSSDGHLEVDPTQVDPAFAEMVNAGRFKKISPSFYLPDSPNNPKPGSLYLRHVGFLGAQPPAVKGLRSPQFAASERGIAEFADWANSQNASLWRRMREWFIAKEGVEEADKVIPDWELKNLEDAARTPTTSSYADPAQESNAMTPEQIAAAQADVTRREQELQTKIAAFAETQSQVTEQASEQRQAQNASFIDGLVSQGKFLPTLKDGVVAFMSQLGESGVVEFGEGDNKQSKPVLQFFRDYLAAQPKVVSYGESHLGSPPANNDDATDIAARAAEFVESERRAGRAVSLTFAVQHVTKNAG